MIQIHPDYIVDTNHNKKSVVLPFEEWEQIVKALEELEDIRDFDAAQQRQEESIPFEQAIRENELDGGVK